MNEDLDTLLISETQTEHIDTESSARDQLFVSDPVPVLLQDVQGDFVHVEQPTITQYSMGEVGPPGPPGASGASFRYVAPLSGFYVQISPAMHNLAAFSHVTVYKPTGEVVSTEVVVDNLTVHIYSNVLLNGHFAHIS